MPRLARNTHISFDPDSNNGAVHVETSHQLENRAPYLTCLCVFSRVRRPRYMYISRAGHGHCHSCGKHGTILHGYHFSARPPAYNHVVSPPPSEREMQNSHEQQSTVFANYSRTLFLTHNEGPRQRYTYKKRIQSAKGGQQGDGCSSPDDDSHCPHLRKIIGRSLPQELPASRVLDQYNTTCCDHPLCGG